jgi:phosphopentomutase
MGIQLTQPFPTFPDGFPEDFMRRFEERIGMQTIGNEVASGTEIINRLGDDHVKTGYPIIYTSADSVFQIAAHEDVIPIDRLYDICRTAREMLTGEMGVSRVIARPFVGEGNGNYSRTERRKDFPSYPEEDTLLDKLKAAGKTVYAVGKIDDLFGGRGITDSDHKVSNIDNLETTLRVLEQDFEGLLFVNLVETDMIYGHRNDPHGYANTLQTFDDYLGRMVEKLKDTDLLIISADHGVDPTTASTDHSREYVPLLVYGARQNVDLGTRHTLSDVGATIAEIFGVEPPSHATSFLADIT